MIFQGVPGARGIAIGKAFVYNRREAAVDLTTIDPQQRGFELAKLDQALAAAERQLNEIHDKALAETGAEYAAIFAAHAAILTDPGWLAEMKDLIAGEGRPAADAVETVSARYVSLFSALEDEYARERAADIKDVGMRLLQNILGSSAGGLEGLTEEVIVVVVGELTPSDIIGGDKNFVRGFVAAGGGKTSHAAIIARARQIPLVLGLGEITEQIKIGETIIVDGETGLLITEPDSSQMEDYLSRQARFLAQQAELKELAQLPAVTTDGRRIELAANIGSVDDVAAVLDSGGDGVGLYRTEFLFLDKELPPSEEEQVAAYKIVLQELAGRQVIVRTLDIGGDKPAKFLAFPKEDNPFLGWRGIRICLDRRDIFKTQLRAILRASAYGQVAIMYPMISDVEELWAANQVLEEAGTELVAAGIEFDRNIRVGIMVETPAAAIAAEALAPEVDFFSIGSNDLCQYTLAVDRTNPLVSERYQPLHPAVLRLIKNVIEVGHRAGKKTGLCGELAGDPVATLILLGFGLDEFSMSAASLPQIKKIIRSVSCGQAREVAEHALTLQTARQVNEYAAAMLKLLDLD